MNDLGCEGVIEFHLFESMINGGPLGKIYAIKEVTYRGPNNYAWSKVPVLQDNRYPISALVC
jgi:hypothetical protein